MLPSADPAALLFWESWDDPAKDRLAGQFASYGKRRSLFAGGDEIGAWKQRLATAFGPAQSRARPVYLRRGLTGATRPISNEDAVTHRLEQEGFLILETEGLSAAEIYRALAAAPVVVCMDGSHMNHLYFSMPRGGSILSFIQADRFTATNFGYACAAGLHFGILVVERDANGYVVDVDAMMRTLDLLPH